MTPYQIFTDWLTKVADREGIYIDEWGNELTIDGRLPIDELKGILKAIYKIGYRKAINNERRE